MRHFILPLALLMAFTGCTNPEYPPAQLPAEFTECQTLDDCVLLELGCCDGCNGGTQVSVRTGSVNEVRDTYSETCGGETACTAMGCPVNTPTCENNTCGVQAGTF